VTLGTKRAGERDGTASLAKIAATPDGAAYLARTFAQTDEGPLPGTDCHCVSGGQMTGIRPIEASKAAVGYVRNAEGFRPSAAQARADSEDGDNTPTGRGRQSPGIELDRLFAFGSESTATASLLM
jgi:hypothetical protein